jgi:glycosyltransferase involved in cell wall biosynthesis
MQEMKLHNPSIKKMRILFQNRANAFDMPGGDTVVMKRLKEQLELHGATVDFSSSPSPDKAKAYNVIHIFNLTVPQCKEAFAKNAVRLNIPFVVTSLQENFPLYYHKAIAAVAWFRDYIAAQTTGGKPNVELPQAIAQVKPANLLTSPFAALAADRIFACGRTEADFIRSVLPNAKVAAVHFGSSIKKIDAPASLFEQAFNIKDFILVVGRLETRKNQLMLLHALESSALPIVFADGGFTYQPEYTQLCKAYKRKGPVIFTGRLSDELLVSAYRACRVHCLPSWYELPGLVSIEAARYGCPIAASSWGCLPDYLHDACTWCSPEDPSSIHDAVISAYEKGERGVAAAIATNFTWEQSGKETVRQYEQVLQEHSEFAPEFVAFAQNDPTLLSFGSFINQITQLVKQNNLPEALAFYDKNRGLFADNANELVQADSLMQRLRSMVKRS